jgi:membrane protein DedA with SNARE-associated domain
LLAQRDALCTDTKVNWLYFDSLQEIEMISGFEDAGFQFVHAYGYVALFVLLALETSMILHFVPSEAIVTVAAAALATDRTRLVLVILVSTLGATAGSLRLYAFARYGGRRFLDRHPRFFGLNAKRRERPETWFQRPAGESLVFILRLRPFFRAAVSLPAGLARMDVRKFTIYSAAGSALFNTALAYSTYAVRANPREMAEIRAMTAYTVSHWPVFLAPPPSCSLVYVFSIDAVASTVARQR